MEIRNAGISYKTTIRTGTLFKDILSMNVHFLHIGCQCGQDFIYLQNRGVLLNLSAKKITQMIGEKVGGLVYFPLVCSDGTNKATCPSCGFIANLPITIPTTMANNHVSSMSA